MTPQVPDIREVLAQLRAEQPNIREVIRQMRAEAQTPAPTEMSTEAALPSSIPEAAGRGFKAGLATVGTAAGATMEALGKIGSLAPEGSTISTMGRQFQEAGRGLEQYSQAAIPPIMDVRSIQSPLDAMKYLTENVAQMVPTMTISVAAYATGGIPLTVLSTFLLEGGNQVVNLREKGASEKDAWVGGLGSGAFNAIAESVVPIRIGKTLAWIPKYKAGLLKGVTGGLKTATLEAGTEGVQEVGSMASEVWAGVPPKAQEALARVLNSVAGGFAGGIGAGMVDVVAASRGEKAPPADVLNEPSTSEPAPTIETTEAPAATGQITKTAEEVAGLEAKPIELVIQDRVRGKTGGTAGLFATYTNEGLKDVLGIEQEAPLRPLIEGGYIAQNAEGLWVLTDKTTGGRAAAVVPLPDVEGWWRDEITGNIYKNFDPGTGAFDAMAVYSPAGEGTAEGYTWTAPDGASEFAETPKILAAAINFNETRRMPQGWTRVADPVREIYTNGVHRVEPVGSNFAVMNADGRLANVGIYKTPSEAALAAEEYKLWREKVHPAARDLWAPWNGDPTKNQPQDARRATTATAAKLGQDLSVYPTTANGHFVLDKVDAQSRLLSQSPFIGAVLARINAYAKVAATVIPTVSDRLNQIGHWYDTAAKRDEYTLGGFWHTAADLGKFVIGLDLIPARVHKNSPVSMATSLYTTLVHELAHSAALGHDGKHEAAIKAINEALAGTKEEFINELYKLYTNKEGTGFSPELLALERQLGIRRMPRSAAQREGGGATGRADRGRVKRPVGSRGPAGRADEIREGEPGGAGTKTGEYLSQDGPESRGDYPPPSAEYVQAVEGLRARRAAEGLQPTTADPDELSGRVLRRVKKSLDMMEGAEGEQEIEEGITHVSRLIRDWTTLRQFERMFPTVAGLKIYRRMVELFAQTKTEVLMLGDRVMKLWGSIHGKMSEQVSKLCGEIMEISMREERRLSQAEILQRAAEMGITDQKVLEVYWEIDKSLGMEGGVLAKMRDAEVKEAQFLYGILAAPAIREIEKRYAMIADRNYFPTARFGRHGILVKALEKMEYNGRKLKKGDTVAFYTWRSRRQRDGSFADMQEKFRGMNVDVSTRYVESWEGPFLGFSPTLYETLVTGLNLNKHQVEKAKEIMYQMSPGQGFVKHMIRKQGVEGVSPDFQAAYTDYMRHAANHIARLTHRRGLETALKSIKPPSTGVKYAAGRQQIHEAMSRHYNDLMNPKNYSGRIGGVLFSWYFIGSAKQAIVNLTQVPMFTYPLLNKRLNEMGVSSGTSDWMVARELARAAKDAAAWLTKGDQGKLEPGMAQQISRGFVEAGLDESYASNLAAFQENKWLTRMFPGSRLDLRFKQLMDYGLWMFKTAEGFNRLQTFMASIRLAQQLGLDAEAQFQFAKDAVLDSHWEYASWNRPLVMRRAPALFVFRSYLQHAVHFTLTNQGGWRFWTMMAVLGGINGLPFAENLLDLLTGFSSYIAMKTGHGNWRVEAENELRGLLQDFGANPDLFMNGVARYSLGMTGAERLFGMPFPAFDLSASIQLGRVVPATEPFSQALAGTKDMKTAMLESIAQTVGAAGSTGMNLFEAVADPTAEGTRVLKYAPSVVKNISRVYDYITKGAYTNAQGQPLVDYDIRNPQHIMEIVGQLLGATPTRITARMEAVGAERQEQTYWLGVREHILGAYALAVGQGNREGVADQLKAFAEFNRYAPASVRMSGADLQQSVRERVKNRTLRSLGLPEARRLQQMHQHFQELYPAPQ